MASVSCNWLLRIDLIFGKVRRVVQSKEMKTVFLLNVSFAYVVSQWLKLCNTVIFQADLCFKESMQSCSWWWLQCTSSCTWSSLFPGASFRAIGYLCSCIVNTWQGLDYVEKNAVLQFLADRFSVTDAKLKCMQTEQVQLILFVVIFRLIDSRKV